MNRPIIALDFENREQVEQFLNRFDESLFVKVGMELFYAEGPQIVQEIHARGHDIFLDLKLYDIPNTVGRAMSVLGGLNVAMTNVHAHGGVAMMKRAAESFKDKNPDGKLIAVTQLTSMNELNVSDEQQSKLSLDDSVEHLARLTLSAGLDGVVSSPLESKRIHETCGDDFLTVTPGIRLSEDSVDDQVRVVTPDESRALGTDYIVVGRSITTSEDPVGKYKVVKSLWQG
ncbi:orotidine-5'-phosphate decarboxylase [Aliicoccus persicus]|uniref:Orotidine 5'-phosphate decarboxylase n=1 Tax=Aliicoccus persicus TaxID=930138 RepID=A0A662Z2I0_9STAP|nr:orotidine-5'-phosphate decarboxylase [Aliicoccus persicus]SEV80922.1 orotidine-5'-phosphate decarboxylase [Aliicoccus persicus]